MMRYFWRLYYLIRPVKGHLLSDLLKKQARCAGIQIVEHKLVRRPTDYVGLGWTKKGGDSE